MVKKLRSKRAEEKQLGNVIKESATQIYLAGLGALAKTQEEGGKLFEALVEEGRKMERFSKKTAEEAVEEVKDRVGDTLGEVKGRAGDTWDRLETVFEDRVSRALGALGVPSSDDIKTLSERVDALTRRVSELTETSAPKRAPRKAAAKKRPAKAPAAKAPSPQA